MQQRRSPRTLWALAGVLALLLPVLVACGGAERGTAGPVPVDGHALGGQNRASATGQGTFLFFDADG